MRASETAGQVGLRRVGLRRVDWVRLLVDDDEVRAEAVGVGFRLPTTCPIPLSLATELIAKGTPSVTRVADHVTNPAIAGRNAQTGP
jgi:hypothetical protein